jgi:ethanolamine utilization protein EutQ (cupin superfamily)
LTVNYLVDFDSLPWQSPMPGVREKRFVEGVLELEFADRVVTASTGNLLFIPSGSEHVHRATAKTTTVTALFVEDAPTTCDGD